MKAHCLLQGKTYCIWKLSDMDNCEQVVSFFLFGQTYKEHWKNDVGSVVGLLNPSIMDNAEKVSPASDKSVPHPLVTSTNIWCINIK